MRTHRGKVSHKERESDQELRPGECHHSRGRQEDETGMEGEGKVDREEAGEADTFRVSSRVPTCTTRSWVVRTESRNILLPWSCSRNTSMVLVGIA